MTRELGEFSELRRQSEAQLRDGVNEILGSFKKNLEDNVKALTLEFNSDLEKYKKDQEKLIEERGVDVVQRAIEYYLSRKIEKSDQLQLVFDSLQKARNDLV